MKTVENDYYFNEHDEDQVRKIYKKNKRKKIKRRFRLLMVLCVVIVVVYYFLSDHSKVQSIRVIGNSSLKTEDILKLISVTKDDYYLFVNEKKLKNEVEQIPLVKQVDIEKDLIGHITIKVVEAEKVAYCTVGNKTYIIDELGKVSEMRDKKVLESLKTCPKLSKFKDINLLKKFAKEYIKIPNLIKNQTSDIVYAPSSSDPTLIKFIMNDGKILYLRVEEISEQLQPGRFDYEAFKTAYSQYNVYRFEGKHVYMSNE